MRYKYCDICSRRCFSDSEKFLHMKEDHNINAQASNPTPRGTLSADSNLNEGLGTEFVQICIFCKEIFNSIAGLRRHIRTCKTRSKSLSGSEDNAGKKSMKERKITRIEPQASRKRNSGPTSERRNNVPKTSKFEIGPSDSDRHQTKRNSDHQKNDESSSSFRAKSKPCSNVPISRHQAQNARGNSGRDGEDTANVVHRGATSSGKVVRPQDAHGSRGFNPWGDKFGREWSEAHLDMNPFNKRYRSTGYDGYADHSNYRPYYRGGDWPVPPLPPRGDSRDGNEFCGFSRWNEVRGFQKISCFGRGGNRYRPLGETYSNTTRRETSSRNRYTHESERANGRDRVRERSRDTHTDAKDSAPLVPNEHQQPASRSSDKSATTADHDGQIAVGDDNPPLPIDLPLQIDPPLHIDPPLQIDPPLPIDGINVDVDSNEDSNQRKSSSDTDSSSSESDDSDVLYDKIVTKPDPPLVDLSEDDLDSTSSNAAAATSSAERNSVKKSAKASQSKGPGQPSEAMDGTSSINAILETVFRLPSVREFSHKQVKEHGVITHIIEISEKIPT